jgi:ABC-type transport system involved in multi-copper enzyme maturation permease subunit
MGPLPRVLRSLRRVRLREWIGGACLVAGAVWLAGPGQGRDGWLELAGWLVLLVLGLAVTHRLWGEIFGPVLVWELVREARRGHLFTLRLVYLGVLLAALGVLYRRWFGADFSPWQLLTVSAEASGSELASFARSFFNTFLGVQLAAVLLLTPGFTAGAIAEERDRKTLDLLLASHLGPGELVVSKLVARLAGLFLLLLGGLPVLGFLLFLGGVDPLLVLAGYAVTVLTLVGIGSVGILQSTQIASPRAAIIRTYSVVLGYTLVAMVFWEAGNQGRPTMSGPPSAGARVLLWAASGNPLVILSRIMSGLEAGDSLDRVVGPVLLDAALFHGVLTACCLWGAARTLRVAGAEGRDPPLITPAPAVVHAQPALEARPPVDDERPMLWKECQAERRSLIGPMSAPPLWAFLALFYVTWIVGVQANDLGRKEWEVHVPGWAVLLLPLVVIVAELAVAVRAAGSFARERERQTLDSLLTTDLTNGEIIRAKWLAAVRSPGLLWYLAWGCLLAGSVMAEVPVRASLLVPLVVAVHAALAATIGLACSLTAANSLHATVRTLVVIGLLSMGHWCIFRLVLLYPDVTVAQERALEEFHRIALTPPLTLFAAVEGEHTGLVLIGLAFYALVAGLLLWAVFASFAWATGRMPVGRAPEKKAAMRDAGTPSHGRLS